LEIEQQMTKTGGNFDLKKEDQNSKEKTDSGLVW
jgi:hypothetical protein